METEVLLGGGGVGAGVSIRQVRVWVCECVCVSEKERDRQCMCAASGATDVSVELGEPGERRQKNSLSRRSRCCWAREAEPVCMQQEREPSKACSSEEPPFPGHWSKQGRAPPSHTILPSPHCAGGETEAGEPQGR